MNLCNKDVSDGEEGLTKNGATFLSAPGLDLFFSR